MLTRAEGSFYEEDLETAFTLFNEYLQTDPSHLKAQYLAEICSLLTHYPTKPLDKMLEFETSVGARDKFYHYWMGRVYVTRYDFKSAISSWEKFLAQKAYKSKTIVDETKRFLAEAEQKQLYVRNGSPYRVFQLEDEINSSLAEINPVPLSSGEHMLVTRLVNTGKRHVASSLLSFEKAATGHWVAAEADSRLAMLPGGMAVVQSSADNNRLLLAGGKRKASLFVADWTGSSWSTPVEIRHSGDQQSGTMSADGRVVYFSATAADGSSQTDLFFSTRNSDGSWSVPLPVAELNTLMDETDPFLSPDGTTLYFSSKGYGGLGGYDVVKSQYNVRQGKWSMPENMGFPLNTPADELSFRLNYDGKSGYLASNRVGTQGLLDVYFFEENRSLELKGRVLAAGSTQPVSGLGVRVVISDEQQNVRIATVDRNGVFTASIRSGIDHQVEVYVDERLALNEVVTIPAQSAAPAGIERDFMIQLPQPQVAMPIAAAEDPVTEIVEYTELEDLGKKFSKGNSAVLRSIYFDHGSDYISSEYWHQLAKLYELLRDNPDLSVQITGYANSNEMAQGNQNLSLLRARSVGSYLIQRKIDHKRLREVGSVPEQAAPNAPKARGGNLNRKIEVLVIE